MRSTLGAGLSTIYLTTRWLTGTTLLLSAEAMVRIGVFSGVGFFVAGVSAFFLFGLLLKMVIRISFEKNGIADSSELVKRFFLTKSAAGYHRLLCISSILSLNIQVLAGAIFLYALFRLPVPYGVLLFAFVGVLFMNLDRLSWLVKYKVYFVALLQFMLIILLVYFFVLNGAQHTYNGIRLFHPYLMVYNNSELVSFLVIVFIVTFGQMLLDPHNWDLSLKIENGKMITAFLLGGFIWGTVAIAFSTLTLEFIYNGGFENFNTILYRLVHSIDVPVLTVLFSIFVFLVLLSSFVRELKTFISDLQFTINTGVESESRHGLKRNVSLPVLLLFSGFFITFNVHPSILDVFYFNSIFISAVIPPFLTMAFGKLQDKDKSPTIVLISAAIGYTLYFFYEILTCLMITVLISVLFSASYLFKENHSS